MLSIILVSIAIVAACRGSVVRSRADETAPSQLETANSVALAVIYAYPLTLYSQTFYNTTANIGVNSINRGNATSTATAPILVRPNADYVYSPVAIDLSAENVEVTLPSITNRSYVFPFYDLYGNNFANLGSVTNSPPGKYLVVPDLGNPGVVMAHPDYPEYQGVISYPTTWGSMMIRINALNNGTDLATVLNLESEIEIKSVCRSAITLGPSLGTEVLDYNTLSTAALKTIYGLNSSDVTAVLSMMAAVQAFNPPENKSNWTAVNDMLYAAGIEGGKYTPKAGLNLTLANEIIGQNFTAAFYQTTPPAAPNPNLVNLGNSWVDFIPSLCGDFKDNYLARAYVAYSGYLQLVYAQAEYPNYVPITGAKLSLLGNQSYIINFGGLPDTAFWSVTIYTEDNYLVPNDLNRCSLHKESALTYPDGTLIFGNASNSAPNEFFQMLVQPSNVAPPANWTSNWLPAPSGGGTFNFLFRCYGPTAGLTNGTYVYPTLTKQSVLV